MKKIELINVGKFFITREGRLPAVEGISLHVQNGEFVSILGPSGCGKSTIFNIICGLVQPDSGRILLEGTEQQQPGRLLSYMPQKDLLLPWKKTIDNVTIAMEIAGVKREEAQKEAMALMPLFGLEGFAYSYPSELSGGMRQRAALMRTILAHKEIILLDEPFGALDAITRADMQSWLLAVWERFKYSVLFVTHDVDEAIFLSDRVYVLSPRPGKVRLELNIKLARPRSAEITTSDNFMKLKKILLRALNNSFSGA